MKAVTVKELRTELKNRSYNELLELCLHLSKFRKENKELLTYFLFESHNEAGYINVVKSEMDEQFEKINIRSDHIIKKNVRKILRTVKKDIRYSKNKETEVELLLYFSEKFKDFIESRRNKTALINIYYREIDSIKNKVAKLHTDLQYDYELRLEPLNFITKR